MRFLYANADQSMELLPEADSVVRHLMPCVTDAAGLSDLSETLRSLGPIECRKTLAAACRAVAKVRTHGAPRASREWRQAVEEAAFWAEAALWAAARGDYVSFSDHVERM